MTNYNLPSDPSTTFTVTETAQDEQTRHLAWTIARAADDRKAENITLLRVTEVCYLTDYFVIATGFSKTQVRAIADAVEEKIVQTFSRYPLRIEGKTEGSWILIDYGDVITHIFLPESREYYNLAAFWGHADERIEFSAVQRELP